MDFITWVKAQRDRVVAWLLIVIGGLCILGGWIGVSGTREVYEQLTYLVSGAIVGLFFLGVGVALLLSADFHDEWRKLDRIEAVLRGRPVPEVHSVLDLDAEEVSSDVAPLPPPSASNSRRDSGRSESVMMASALPAGVATLPIRRELTWAVPGLLVSVALIATGWAKSSGSTDPQVGADALLIAVYGVFACGIGIALHSRWLRRELAQRKGGLLGRFLDASPGEADDPPNHATSDSAEGYYVVDGGRRYHRAECGVIASGGAAARPASQLQLRELAPCRLCDSDEAARS